jgi:hypothetical protein
MSYYACVLSSTIAKSLFDFNRVVCVLNLGLFRFYLEISRIGDLFSDNILQIECFVHINKNRNPLQIKTVAGTRYNLNGFN